MYKVAWLVKLAPDGDREELTREWDGEHADLMRAVPGLERHVVNKGLAVAEGPGAGFEAPAVDAVACAWFTDRAAFEAALASPEWEAVAHHGGRIFDQDWEHAGRAVEIEEQVMRVGAGTAWSGADVPEGMCKHVGVLYFRPDLERSAARAWWRDVHGKLALAIPEILYYVQSHSSAALRLDGADAEDVYPFDGFSEAWFTDRPTFERAHESPPWLALREDSPNLFDVEAIESGVNLLVYEEIVKS